MAALEERASRQHARSQDGDGLDDAPGKIDEVLWKGSQSGVWRMFVLMSAVGPRHK